MSVRAPPRPAWAPPSGGGPGTAPSKPRQSTHKPAGGGITGVKMTVGGGGMNHPADHGATIAQEKTAAYMIDNLKRQVQLLEHDNQQLRTSGGGGSPSLAEYHAEGGGGGAGLGVDGTIRKLRSDYERNEGAHAAREQELIGVAERFRKEALAAKLRERNALEEMAEAKELLTEQREKFAAARQELTAEVIAYQRDLDELAHEKRQLQADLADCTRELAERAEFMEGFDAKVRLLEAQLDAKAEEAARALKGGELLRAELNDERAQAANLRDKYDVLKAHQAQVEDLRGSFAEEAIEASAELRKARIELESEQHARKMADDAKSFLVHETAKLEATIKELSGTAEFIARENARLKAEAGNSKVTKVVGRFMVRKMREKLTEAQHSEALVRANEAALHHRFVRAEQKSGAIETELMKLRRRMAEREAAYEQQRADASDLSVENRMLLEKTEQLVSDAQRTYAKLEMCAAANVELAADADVLRERLDVMSALGKFKPEDLASVSNTNAALAEAISALLPKLEKTSAVARPAGGAPPTAGPSSMAGPPSMAATSYELGGRDVQSV